MLGQCAGIAWDVATRADEVKPALARVTPSIVFSNKHSGFPGEAHRPAIEAPSVRWFHVAGSGSDHVAGHDASRVTITTSAGVLAPYLAERAMAALLHFTTGIDGFVSQQRSQDWAPTPFQSLRSKTVLVVGAGAVGTAFAQRARAFGAHTVGVRRKPAQNPAFDEMLGTQELAGALQRADVLALHVPLLPATRGLIGADELARLPAGAVVMNSSRGAVLDATALLHALDRNVAAAWLDVFDVEPLPRADPLWRHPRVLVTPHCADHVVGYSGLFAQRFHEVWQSLLPGNPQP